MYAQSIVGGVHTIIAGNCASTNHDDVFGTFGSGC
jgi:hypothetical protein